jgi:hypothetical protein
MRDRFTETKSQEKQNDGKKEAKIENRETEIQKDRNTESKER